MQVTLYDWGPSPFCLKVRALFDYKKIEYDRVNVLSRAWFKVNRQGKIGKVPAVEWDGELVCDSTDIAHLAEQRCPEPRVVPADPRERAMCHAIEEWADESLYFLGLYFQWEHPEGRAMVPQVFGKGPMGKMAYRFYLSRIRKQIRGQGTARKPIDHLERDLERQLAAAADLVAGGGFALGDAPMLCDFALMAQLVYLSRTPVGGPPIAAHPALTGYLERMRALRSG